MLDQIFQTGMVLLFSAVVIRKCSEDDAAEWWKILVVLTGGTGFVSMVVSSLIMIWT